MTTIKDDKLEAMFGVSADEIAESARPWDSGELPGHATGPAEAGPALIGRPLKFGSSMRSIGFRETVEKVAAIDERAKSLGLARSDYLRLLVDRDLAMA